MEFNDSYTAITPFGIVRVSFPEDAANVFEGDQDSVAFLKASMLDMTDGFGQMIDPETINPESFFNFCQPEGSGIEIIKPVNELMDEADDAIAALDSISPMERIKLSADLARNVKDLANANSIKKITIAKDIAEILAKIGVQVAAVQIQGPTAKFYPQEQRRTAGARQKDNDAAVELMQRITAEGRKATDEERAVLARFSGYGGGLVDRHGKEGSPYEYYTPAPVAAGMWSLMAEMGFSGGKVLDPSAGSGVFAATRPHNAVIDQVELDETSGGVNALVNDSDTSTMKISPFEAVAAATPDESYDAVVTNVPFGDANLRLTAKQDNKLQDASLEAYFILRSLDKLKPKGLAAFIVPPRIVSGMDAKMKDLRYQVSMRAEFLGAYRLPSKVFKDASDADTIVDVIVFRKFARDAKTKVDEIAAANIDTLIAANVLWDEFLSGKYFRESGRKFQLGEFQAKDPNKFRDVDRVISDQSTANISKMLRKFPASRIDWGMLDATETAPIAYNEGDVIHQDGQTLELRDGRWVARENSNADDSAMREIGILMDTPLAAVGTTWEQGAQYVEYMRNRDKSMDLPNWLLTVYGSVSKLDAGAQPGWYQALVAGLAAIDVLRENAQREPLNYATAFPELSAAIQGSAPYGKKSEASFKKILKDAAKTIAVIYSKRAGFSARWKGDVQADVSMADLTPERAYEKVKYNKGDDFGYVATADIAGTQGADFDPFQSPEWCVSPDGTSVMRADDYFYGNYADFLTRATKELEQATDPKVRDKIMRQMEIAKGRLIIPDVERMTFNLFSPFIPMSRKLEFLREHVDGRFGMEFDDDGKPRIIIDIGSTKDERDRQLKRFAEHLRVGTLTTRTSESEIAEDPNLEASRLAQLRELVSGSNAKFNIWVKSNADAFGEIKKKLTDPSTVYFQQAEDDSPLEIQDMSPSRKAHGYQSAEVRRQAKKFGGINGFDVGLGKTLTALAAVQYAQSIGVKKKTFIVVPNSVLSNWRKEAVAAYLSMEDCLFVGLDVGADGSISVDSSNYARDLNRIMENRHRKVFMTMQAFGMIPMKDETLEAYKDYIKSVDPSFAEASDKKAEQIRKAGKREKLVVGGEKSAAIPFFEDMNCDSVVLDEAHQMKNSKLLLEFQSAKYLSSPVASNRGLDAQIKAWYVRGQSPNKDGIYCLTATPITNSPLEIYGMLSLAVGEEELNARMQIQGGDDFMNAFSEIAHLEEPDLVGRPRAGRVFLGLQNVNLLRSALMQIANIKSAKDVGGEISVPEEDAQKTAVELDDASKVRLSLYQKLYIAARAIVNEEGVTPEQMEMVDAFSKKSGESVELLAHPFNLINKMSNLIMDKDLERGATAYRFNAGHQDKAEKAVAQFNTKKIKEKRDRAGIFAKPENITVREKKSPDGAVSTETIVTVEAWIADGNVMIDSDDYDTQGKFLDIATKIGLDCDVEYSPKIAAFLENFKKEQAMPKAKGGIAKQIIFCDMLGMHHKIKIALVKRCGIPASKIAVINAEAIDDPADMQDVQDGFNGDADENRYKVIIANKKAEVGVNLQKGTQAIHHLTIGWTPDSLTQRNGRGVRQGNYLSRVSVYHYDANGTFDEYKRSLVGKKDDWISSIMEGGDTDSVRVSGGLSKNQLHDLMMANGNDEAMKNVKAQIEKREREQQTAASRESQIQTLRVVQGQQAWIKKFPGADAWRQAKINEYVELQEQVAVLSEKIDRARNEDIKARLVNQKSDIQARAAAVESLLKGSSLDYRGNPDDGLGFRTESWRRGKDKNAPRATGTINPESALAKKYLVERSNIEAALDRARKEYSAQSKRFGAYTEQTLKDFESGEAEIVGGVLLQRGMVGRHKNKLWIAASTEYLIHPPTQNQMKAQGAVSGFEWFGPADADEDWTPIADACAAADEETIAANKDNGFEIGDYRLYSTFSADIADRVKSVPSGVFTFASSINLIHPYYPKPVSPDTVGGPLTKAIIAEQSKLVEWGARDRVRVLRVTDCADGRQDEGLAVIRYAAARNLKITDADVRALNIYRLDEDVSATNPEFHSGFDEALQAAVTAAKTGADVDASIQRYIEASFPIMQFGDVISADMMLLPNERRKIDNAKTSILSGGKPVVWMDEMFRDNGLMNKIAAYLRDTMKARADKYLADGRSLLDSEQGMRDAVDEIVYSTEQSPIPDSTVVSPEVAKIVMASSVFPVAAGGIVLNKGGSSAIYQQFAWSGLKEVQAAVKQIITAQFTSGVDVEGMLSALRALPDIESVNPVASSVYRPAKYGNGNFTYGAGSSVAVKTKYKSKTADRISNKAEGLAGRHWDRDQGWMLTLAPGEKDSAGKNVASVSDLCAFLGVDISAFKKAA